MRFKNYLINDNKILIFNSLKINLIENKTEYNQIIDFINEKYNIKLNISDSLNKFNLLLKKYYKGKYKFGLCLDEGIIPDNLKKIKNKQLINIKKEWYRINDEFANIQKLLEKHLQNNIGRQ